MFISVDPNDVRPIYVQIMDEVRRALVLGVLSADDPLPSARQLAIDLRVNPNTVSQAYRELEREGLAYVRRGQGTFVHGLPKPAEQRDRLAESVAQQAIRDAKHNGLSVDELIEAIRTVSSHPSRTVSSHPSRTESTS